MALRAGSTDNVTAVIADATLALDADAFDLPHQTPLVGGAASASLETIADIVNEPVASAPPLREGKQSPAARAAALRSGKDPNEEPKQPEQRVAQPSSVREDNGDRVNTDTGKFRLCRSATGVFPPIRTIRKSPRRFATNISRNVRRNGRANSATASSPYSSSFWCCLALPAWAWAPTVGAKPSTTSATTTAKWRFSKACRRASSVPNCHMPSPTPI